MLDETRLQFIPALRILATRYPVNPPAEQPRPSWLVCWRGADFQYYRRDLTEAEHDLLTSLPRTPLKACAEHFPAIARWIGDGLFQPVSSIC